LITNMKLRFLRGSIGLQSVIETLFFSFFC